MPHRILLVPLLTLALLGTGCLTRTIKQPAFEANGTEVFLRSYKRGLSPVAKGYQHPVTIAPVRMAHILSRIDMRSGAENERVPAVPLDTLYTIADGMSQVLAEAGPDQEVVVLSRRRQKSLLVFDHYYLTTLLAFMRDDLLYIQVGRSDWEIDKRRERSTGLPEPYIGQHEIDFRLVVDRGMTLQDAQTVAVHWRDDIFRKPTRTRVTSTGKVVRRQVLMESLEDESIELETPSPVSGELTPEQLRALADLEEARQRGEVSEAQYQSRRGRILRGEPVEP